MDAADVLAIVSALLMGVSVRDDLDRFYTKPEIAAELVKLVDFAGLPVVEPSAGAGAFSSLVDCYAYDLSPAVEGVVEKNWFDVTEELIPGGEGFILLGNPPFGKRAVLAKRFISHGIKLGAVKVAFVLPSIFNKFLTQKVFPSTWSLTLSKDLGDDCFLFNGVDEHIPCVFQIWEFDPQQQLTNLRLQPAPVTTDFRFVGRGSGSASFCLNGNSGKVRDISEVTNPKAEHYLVVDDPLMVDVVKSRLSAVQWDFHSACSGGVAWVGKDEIFRKYAEVLV